MARAFFISVSEILSNVFLIVTGVLIAKWVEPLLFNVSSVTDGVEYLRNGIIFFIVLGFLFKLLASQLKKE